MATVDDRNYRFTSSFLAALAQLGVAHAAVSPGSRNTPISMTLAAEDRIHDWSHHDERSAAFFALGIGKATRRPALVTCTSGTAAAEIHPAVIEARYGRVPLIVVTADRPTDLWETGSPQTIDQRGMYGSAPLWSHDLDVPGPDDAAPGFPAALAARLVAEALAGPGPVHLNLRFREPLIPLDGIPAPVGPVPEIGYGLATPGLDDLAAVAAILGGKKGVIVIGSDPDGRSAAAVDTAQALGFPILADPQTPARTSGAGVVIGAGTALMGVGILDRLRPEVVVRIGSSPTSKPLAEWMARSTVPQILIGETGWADPGATVSHVVRAHPAPTLVMLRQLGVEAAPPDWLDEWRDADRRAQQALEAAIAGLPFPTEPGIAAIITGGIPEGALLYVASSMPIRDLDLVMTHPPRPFRVAANRGANGIDGLISSGLGVAALRDRPVFVLTGDLSAIHDLTALATAAREKLPITIVIIDNNGGGIFHFLPQAGFPDRFERHFGTPHGLDLVAAARSLGVEAALVEDAGTLQAAVTAAPEAPRVMVVKTDRHANPAIHQLIMDAVGAALG